MVAYYLILTNMCLCEENFGSPFTNNLPQVTIQNSFGNIANFVERCVHWDGHVAFLPWCQIEWPCEPQFGKCKKIVRGMGRLKDMIQGAGAEFSDGFPEVPNDVVHVPFQTFPKFI